MYKSKSLLAILLIFNASNLIASNQLHCYRKLAVITTTAYLSMKIAEICLERLLVCYFDRWLQCPMVQPRQDGLSALDLLRAAQKSKVNV